jgi:hypothetical protein
MGYYVSQMDDCQFKIKKENIAGCLQALKEMAKREANFSWVQNVVVRGADTITQAFDEWRWQVKFNEDGDVSALYFEGQKLGDEDSLFQTIAPFVEAGSYIGMSGEEDCIWRYCFDGTDCVESHPEMVWK